MVCPIYLIGLQNGICGRVDTPKFARHPRPWRLDLKIAVQGGQARFSLEVAEPDMTVAVGRGSVSPAVAHDLSLSPRRMSP